MIAPGEHATCQPLVPGRRADIATAQSIFRFVRERVAPYKRVRKLEFRDLPKTVSGKIRRADLRRDELAAAGRPQEFLEDEPLSA